MHLDAGNLKWPLVMSVLFYHGERSPYPYASELTEYYEDPILGSQQLFFRFYLIDILQISDQDIISHGICAPVELLLKHGRDSKFELPVESYRSVFNDCIKEVGDDYIFSMLTYAQGLADLEIGEKIYKFIEQVFTDKQELIMTYGQKLQGIGKQEGLEIGMLKGLEKGMQQGLQQGIKEEKLNLARVMLQDDEPIEKIMRWTGLNRQAIENIEQDRE
jgi:predicted transposase YdaD